MTALPRVAAAEPIERLLAPFRDFTQRSAAGGVLLMAAAVVAIAWANSPLAASYGELWATKLGVEIGGYGLSKPLLLWINDGLMAVFFLVVGLEIKREWLVGELASPRRAALPIAAAAGGAILPALIFLAFAASSGELGSQGWGVPMATDIAFALGVLALLGSRVPLGLKVFLTALAIVDDLIAVLVIAVFYASVTSPEALGAAAAILGLLVVANRLGVRRPLVYGALGLALWLALLQSGIHATIAGVLLALTVPARTRVDAPAFSRGARRLVEEYESCADEDCFAEERHAALWDLETLSGLAQAPMLRLEHALQPWAAFVIVPLFALANAGVVFGADLGATLTSPIVGAVAVGLVAGKQIGIALGSWLVVRSDLAVLPEGVRWLHVYGAAWLGGIGFTMSLLIADLAYGHSTALDQAKVGILAASIVAGVGGYAVLRLAARRS